VPGISKKRGQNQKNWPESKESASAGYFKKEGAESKELVVPGISNLLNQPNLVFIIDLPK
jgi:hypothetical protein